MPSRRHFLTSALAGAALLGTGWATGAYRATVAAASQRLNGAVLTAPTRWGTHGYAVAGRGAPLMMVHGTGGGWDQGLRFGAGLVRRGLQVIAPSRFGYPGTPVPADPSPAAQADAFADLLDHLRIDRLPVAGGSAGALSAAEFALRHPDRCSALILLVPAANLTGQDPVEFTALQRFFVSRLLTSDRWFWAAATLAPDQMIGTLLATDPALLGTVSAEERARARAILAELMPISRRAEGIALDGHYAGHPAAFDISRLTVPTLVISSEDDRFGTAATARLIAGHVPSARLVIYPTGGHIWLGHDEDAADEIVRFVAQSPAHERGR